jgi:hypothetical protein
MDMVLEFEDFSRAVENVHTRAPDATEPVAWRWRSHYSDGPYCYGDAEPRPHPDYLTEPLYLAPPAKPVSVETIERVIREHVEYGYERANSRQESIVGVENAAADIHALIYGGDKSDLAREEGGK